jgi:glucans biosynthesis protein C
MNNTTGRINGFDALRTIAMWLGVVLHSIIAYKYTPESGWPKDMQFNSVFLDWLYDFIHIFRMPLFYMVAGFFARLVIMKSGMQYFIKQRYKRILIPFIIGIIVIVPLTMLPFQYYRFHFLRGISADTAWHMSIASLLKWNGIAHLWFLYYLIFFYIATYLFKTILFDKIIAGSSFLNFKVKAPFLSGALALSVALITLQLYYKQIEPPVYTGIKPILFHFLYYGLFYFTGWLLNRNMNHLLSVSRYGLLFFLVGLFMSITDFSFLQPAGPVKFIFGAIETLGLTFGITGLFIKYFHRENKIWRYFSDSAYWVYLMHMGIVAMLQIGFLNSELPPFLRPLTVLFIIFIISVLSYNYLVRYTIIGTYLNGKKTRK